MEDLMGIKCGVVREKVVRDMILEMNGKWYGWEGRNGHNYEFGEWRKI